MMGFVFAIITLFAVILATFESQLRRAILALWVAGVGVGAIYLTVGAEFLAIIQWIVSTMVTISFLFFAVMFGEYNAPPEEKKGKGRLLVVLAVILGAVFSAIIGLGSSHLPEGTLKLVSQADGLGVLGRKLTRDHLLSLEVLALTLFLVLVGGGVVARSEGGES